MWASWHRDHRGGSICSDIGLHTNWLWHNGSRVHCGPGSQAVDAMCYMPYAPPPKHTPTPKCLVVHGLISLEQDRGTLWRSHALHASDEHNPAWRIIGNVQWSPSDSSQQLCITNRFVSSRKQTMLWSLMFVFICIRSPFCKLSLSDTLLKRSCLFDL